jgi:fatty-acyl-CoA synthase
MEVISAMYVPWLVTHYLRRGIKLYGPKTCVVDGEKRFTYEQFGERVNRLSNALLIMGVMPGDRVAFLGPNGHRILESYFGVVQIGGILTCLNIRLGPEELRYILDHCGAKFVCVDHEYTHLLTPIIDKLETVQKPILLTNGERPEGIDWPSYDNLLSAASPEAPPEPQMRETDVAEIFYTSGTTATPKGVMLTHRNLCANAQTYMTTFALTDSDAQLHTIPLFHVNGWGAPHALTAVGGKHVMMRQFRARQVFEAIQAEKVTIGAMVPAMLNTLLNDPDYKKYDFSTWKKLIIGGAPVPASFIKEASEKFGVDAHTGYGMTEASPIITMATLKSHLKQLPKEDQYARKAKTGIEVVGVQVRVVDKEGRDVKNNGIQVGEIIARGNNVMKGYWRDPEATNKVIIDGWLHTGDLATIDEDSYINIVDRAKDMIITGGENVASAEIEMALYSHSAVLECAVIGVPDPKWGESPMAIVALKPGEKATAEELLAHCSKKLAKFKVPKSVEFMESLPKTGTSKIQKNVLRKKYGDNQEQIASGGKQSKKSEPVKS